MVPEVKPSAKWFMLPTAGFLIGAILLIFGIRGAFGTILAEKITLYPGATVTVEEEGEYSIYYEYRFAYTLREDVVFTFVDHDGRRHESRFPRGSVTYTVNGVNGERVAVVDLAPGAYTVETTQQDLELNFVMDKGGVGGMALGIIGFVFGLLLLIPSIIGLIVILVLRRANRRRLQQNPYYNQ